MQGSILADFAEIIWKNGHFASQTAWRYRLCQQVVLDSSHFGYRAMLFVSASITKVQLQARLFTSLLAAEAPP